MSDPRLEVWRYLLDGDGSSRLEEWITEIDADGPATRRSRKRLETSLKTHAPDVDPVMTRTVLFELRDARERARAKWTGADRVVATKSGIQQASGARVGEWKARRFGSAGVTAVVDVCAGVGGDARAFVREFGAESVIAIDRDEVAMMCARRNASCSTIVDDFAVGARRAVVELGSRGARIGVHIDPARRDAKGRRGPAVDELEPGLERCLELCRELGADHGIAHFAIKLAPGIRADDVHDLVGRRLPAASSELEWIAEPEGLVQAVLWLADGPTEHAAKARPHRATRISSALDDELEATTFAAPVGAALPPLVDPSVDGMVLLEPDRVLERAELFGAWLADNAIEAHEVFPGLGLHVVPAERAGKIVDDGVSRTVAHRVLASMPWRTKAIRACLDEHRWVVRQCRTRGGAIDVDRSLREIRAGQKNEGPGETTRKRVDVWGLRLGQKRIAVMTESRVDAWPTLAECS